MALGYINLEGGVHKSTIQLPEHYACSENMAFFFPHWKQNI